MRAPSSRKKAGFLNGFHLADQYLLPPNAASGRPGLLEGQVEGINVLIKVWPKKPREDDSDLAEIWRHELRQLHRLEGYPGAIDQIASLHSAGLDKDGFYLVLDPGQRRPLETILQNAPPGHWLKNPRSPENRLRMWLNLDRAVHALETLHAQGLLHRSLDTWSILTSGNDDPDFQLTGFEWSIRLSGEQKVATKRRVRTVEAGFDSFRADWAGMGHLAGRLLSARMDRVSNIQLPPSEAADHLDVSEIRLLRQLIGIEPSDRLDGESISQSIENVVERLKAGIARKEATYRLVVRLGPTSKLTQSIRNASGLLIEANDIGAQEAFIRDDLATQPLLMALQLAHQANAFRLVLRGHQLLYRVEAYQPIGQDASWDFAYCESSESQPPLAKHIVGHPITLTPNTIQVMNAPEAREHFARLRRRVTSWESLRSRFLSVEDAPSQERKLMRAFALSQLVEMSFAVSDIFPVEVKTRDESGDGDDQYRIYLEVRQDEEREQLAKALSLASASERFEQLLKIDDPTGENTWTLTDSAMLGDRTYGDTEWKFVRVDIDATTGRSAYVFAGAELAPSSNELFLLPSGSVGTIVQFRRRTRSLEALGEHLELLRMLTDPRGRILESHDNFDATDDFFSALDAAKQDALRELTAITPLYLLQGPPGVGKTHLVRELVRRRFAEEPTARLLLTAQSHAAVDHLMGETKALLTIDDQISSQPLVVRCRKKDNVSAADPFDVREQASKLIKQFSDSELVSDGSANLQARIRAMVEDSSTSVAKATSSGRTSGSRAAFESVVLRAANVVFATTNAPELERLIEERGLFDWTIVEEAGKATGGELIAPLMLSHRRLMIGDHKQLPPYRSDEMRALLENPEAMREVIKLAPPLISSSLRGSAIDDLLDEWEETDAIDLGGTASEALLLFEAIIETEFQRQRRGGSGRRIARSLTVQHRMHPDIAALVSTTFYDGMLTTDKTRETRFANEPTPVTTVDGSALPDRPITVVKLPDVQSNVHQKRGDDTPPWWNAAEVSSVIDVLAELRPREGLEAPPSLAVLSPYAEQVKRLHRAIESEREHRLSHLSGFKSANDSQSFCSTVDAFQGSEADVVVISLVRNNEHTKPALALGFLRDFRRMNVLLSRAKHRLILVGSLDFLRSVIDAMQGQQAIKYSFLSKLISQLTDGIDKKKIGSVTSTDLRTGKK